MVGRAMRWRYLVMHAWLAALAAMPLLQGGQCAGSQCLGGLVWELLGLLTGLVVWRTVREGGVVATPGAQRTLVAVGSIGLVMLALSLATFALEGTLPAAALRLAEISGAAVAEAAYSSATGVLSFASAFLFAYCCVRIGRMSRFEVVSSSVRSLIVGKSGTLASVVSLIGGVLFAAMLFWGYAPEGEGGAYSFTAWAAATGCFVVVVLVGMLALCPDKADAAAAASGARGAIRTMLDRFEEDDARLRFEAFYLRVVAAWAAGAGLLVLVFVVSPLPKAIPDSIRWMLVMALLVDVLALVAAINHARIRLPVSCLDRLAVLANRRSATDASEGSRCRADADNAEEPAYGAADGSGASVAEAAGRPGEAGEVKAPGAGMQFARTGAMVAHEEVADAYGEPVMSAALQSAVSRQGLTKREATAVAWVLTGRTSSEAAARMGLKASTVRVYVQRAYRKLGMADFDEARSCFAQHVDGASACKRTSRGDAAGESSGPDAESEIGSYAPNGIGAKSVCALADMAAKGRGFASVVPHAMPSENTSDRLEIRRSCLVSHPATPARFLALLAVASGLAAIILLFVPRVALGGLSQIGEGVYAGCAAALLLTAGASLLARAPTAGAKDVGGTADEKGDERGFHPSSSGQCGRGDGIPTVHPFVHVVRQSRVGACAFAALTAALGCATAELLWLMSSASGIWPAIMLAMSFAFTLCVIGWGRVLVVEFGPSRVVGACCTGTRLSMCVGCCAAVFAGFSLQAIVPWVYFALAAAATVVFVWSSVAALAFRGGLVMPPGALPFARFKPDEIASKALATPCLPGEARLVVRCFAMFCAVAGFMWSRMWEGHMTSFFGLAETLFEFVAVIGLCVFFAAQTRGRSRVFLFAFIIAGGILYVTGISEVIVYAFAILSVLLVLWFCDEGLFRSSSLSWCALAFAVGSLLGLAYAAGVDRNVALWQDLGMIGLAGVLPFVQLSLAATSLLALVGLGLSLRLALIERRARMALRALEAGVWEDRVHSYLAGRGLNPLQVDVVVSIVQGRTSAQMADALSYSTGSINTARLVAYRVLDVHDRAQLAELLVRETGLANMCKAGADRRAAYASDTQPRE